VRSALYRGRVSHVRSAPVEHRFEYGHGLLALDLDELEAVFERLPLASLERPNLISFRRRDYLGDARVPLAAAVRAHVREQCPELREGPVTLLTQPRVLGLVFNPVSFYFLYEPDGAGLQAIVAEITNTPWNERHAYVLPAASAERHGERLRFRFDKRFHVSPFMGMDVGYDWQFEVPGETLEVGMTCLRGGRAFFHSQLELQREPLTGRGLARALLAQPGLSFAVLAAIYLQALRLRAKGAPFHEHPARRAARAGVQA
jgi:DUF1365 family protein